MNKECPHCHENSFGWRELVILNFTPETCKNCHKLVHNSGGRQLLSALAIISIILAGLLLLAILSPDRAVLLVPVAVVVLLMVVVVLAKPVKAEDQQTDLSPFTPNPNNDKTILIQGWNEVELRQILDDFVEQDLSAFTAFRIQIEERSEHSFALTFPEDVHPAEFLSLINYLACPVNFDPAGRSIVVAGRTILNSDFDGLPKSVLGEMAILFVPENEEDYHVVCLQTESGVSFEKSINEGAWRKTNDDRLSPAVSKLIW